MKELKFFAGPLVFVVALIAVLSVFTNWITGMQCSAKASAMNLEHSYGMLQGCIVNYKGTYMPIENVGVREIIQEGR